MTTMHITDYSPWGIALLLVLTTAVMGLMALTDRPTMLRLAKVLVFFLLSMAVVALCGWGLTRLWSWWLGLLWSLLVGVGVALVVTLRARQSWRCMLPTVLPAVLAGMVVGGGSMVLTLPRMAPPLLLMAADALLAGQLAASLSQALQTYLSSRRHTAGHYRYLVANGATRLEAVMPSVRRSLRAALMPSLRAMTALPVLMPPALFCALLLAGTDAATAAVATVTVVLALLAAAVTATVAMLWLLDRTSDRQKEL